MDKDKIKIFNNENAGKIFPKLVSISNEKRISLLSNIANWLESSKEENAFEVLKLLTENELVVEGWNADNSIFNLHNLVNYLSIIPNNRVYINWNLFDDVDLVEFTDLCKHFIYFWYPGADDIDIFDETLKWIVSIDHNGYISYIKK
ncbi:MAG: hypothetical protein PF692_07870 [Kiritimatiellae bacterium]|jgi:hypothetical protein|nr:hypothetical protein [Kiritimatiellia bacterium]